jgi:hypothetical protein
MLNLALELRPSTAAAAAAPAYDTDAQSYFSRLSVQPDASRKALLNDFVVTMKQKGWWPHFKFVYVQAAHDAQAARQNMVADLGNLLLVGAPTFVLNSGYEGDAAGACLRNNVNLNASGITQNSHFQYYADTKPNLVPGANKYAYGASANGTVIALQQTSEMSVRLGSTSGTTAGMFSIYHRLSGMRISSNLARSYRNGVMATQITSATAVLNAYDLFILRTASASTDGRCGFFILGSAPETAALADQMAGDVDAAVYTYLKAIGAQP